MALHGGLLTKSMMGQSKTQFYGTNGTGRDTYIHTTNGGFCPPIEKCQMESLGKVKHSPSFQAVSTTKNKDTGSMHPISILKECSTSLTAVEGTLTFRKTKSF